MHYVKIFCLAGLLSLVALRPWRTVNATIGVRSVSDSVKTLVRLSDAQLVEQGMALIPATPAPVQVVLQPDVVDSLNRVVEKKELALAALAQKNRQLDKKITTLAKAVNDKQGSIVSLKEINEMLARQNQQRPSPDDEPDLVKELNRPHRKRPDK